MTGVIGKILGHYEILALIGRGGMGEVYRARDTRLDREVALKVLPAGMAADPTRLERFLREARTVAGLNHPHIVTLHAVEEADGVRFLVMELVDGQPLDAILTPEGLPIKRVIEIGVGVADALAAAHEKGIVHRDLKPANVMITTDGRAKVLDFGIARTAAHNIGAGQTDASLTRDGMVMGTVPYMSPEQVRGERVDHRSDIFSLGTMLYQLTAGTLPFHGDYAHAIGYAIVNETPPPLTRFRNDVPAELVRIIDVCLAKNPAKRYAAAAVLRDELRALQTQTGSRLARRATQRGRRTWIAVIALVVVGAASYFLFGKHGTPARTQSIAVLPFMNLSGDAGQDYFSDGISEELLNLLAQVPNLKVAARTSSFSFKGKEVAIPEIGHRLNVNHVLEGSVRKSGNQVRITAQLVQAADGFHVWSQTYDRTLDDVFSIQDEIAADVVKQLKVTLLGEAPKARPTDPRAYAHFLLARDMARQLRPRTYAVSDSLYQLALAIDSTYAPAWVGLSSNYVNEISFGFMPSDEGFRRSKQAALKAIQFDPDNGLAYSRLGIVEMWSDNDLVAAAKNFERALTLAPNDATLLMNTAQFLVTIDRPHDAIAVLRSAAALDPVNVNVIANLGAIQSCVGQFDEGIANMNTALALSPTQAVLHYQIGVALTEKGDPAAGLLEVEQEQEVFKRIGLPLVYSALGRSTDADSALADLIAKDGDASAYNVAQTYAFRGENDRAFEWLDRAYALRDPGLANVTFDSLFRKLYGDPRWSAFLEKIGKSPEQLEKIQFRLPVGIVP